MGARLGRNGRSWPRSSTCTPKRASVTRRSAIRSNGGSVNRKGANSGTPPSSRENGDPRSANGRTIRTNGSWRRRGRSLGCFDSRSRRLTWPVGVRIPMSRRPCMDAAADSGTDTKLGPEILSIYRAPHAHFWPPPDSLSMKMSDLAIPWLSSASICRLRSWSSVLTRA